MKRNPPLTRVANHIVTNIFANHATRLVLIDKHGKHQGGWGVMPLRDHILSVLREEFYRPGRKKSKPPVPKEKE